VDGSACASHRSGTPAAAQSQIHKYGRRFICSKLCFHFRDYSDVSHRATNCLARVVCLGERAHSQQSGTHFTAGEFSLPLADATDAADCARNSLSAGVRVTATSHLKKTVTDTGGAHFLFAFSDATYAGIMRYKAVHQMNKARGMSVANTCLWHEKSIQQRHRC
jgi:hypothetical protein